MFTKDDLRTVELLSHIQVRGIVLSANNAGKILYCQNPGWNSKLNVTFQSEWYHPKQLHFLLYLIFLFYWV